MEHLALLILLAFIIWRLERGAAAAKEEVLEGLFGRESMLLAQLQAEIQEHHAHRAQACSMEASYCVQISELKAEIAKLKESIL